MNFRDTFIQVYRLFHPRTTTRGQETMYQEDELEHALAVTEARTQIDSALNEARRVDNVVSAGEVALMARGWLPLHPADDKR